MNQLHPMYPIEAEITHPANIFIAFDNYGKTPGVIREVRAKLFLTIKDRVPTVNYGKLPVQEHDFMIAGDTRAKEVETGWLDLKQEVKFTPVELAELLHAGEGQFRRFALIGQVIYDDFFGMRHTSRFCVKMRSFRAEGDPSNYFRAFQIPYGGRKYNHVVTTKVPKRDPFDKT